MLGSSIRMKNIESTPLGCVYNSFNHNYQLPLIKTAVLHDGVINIAYFMACGFIMTLHLLNRVVNDV